MSHSPPTSPPPNNNNNNNYKNSTPGGGQMMAGTPVHSPASGVGAATMMEAWELPSTRGVMLHLVLRQLRLFLGFSRELSPANLWAGLSHMRLQTAFRRLG